MTIRMFCGELQGDLISSYISTTAGEVRFRVGSMFEPGQPAIGWIRARKEGWRVVPVNVTRAPRVTR